MCCIKISWGKLIPALFYSNIKVINFAISQKTKVIKITMLTAR
nr:MAG TPA: hypothetical protein [Caudoviricetes sp.]